MATFRLRHFSSPHVLRGISPERLLSFLSPYREFFESRDYELSADATEELDYERLVNIFMTPTEDSPAELLDALFLVDEMATPFSMATLIDSAEHQGFELEDGDEHSPADIAIQIWLLNPDILERKHAEQFLSKRKSFEYFQTANDPPSEFPGFPAATQRRMEQEMNDWFESKKRGRGVRVFAYPDDNEVRFLVRHGEPFKREETMSGADVGSVCYRPLKYDVVVYDRRVGELRINASLVGEKRFYRQQFGKHIFGDVDHFPGNAKYTLEPLREYGSASLNCFEVEEIESIMLTEVQFLWGGPHGLVEVLKASDVFAALAGAGRDFPEQDRIIKAGFKVKFADSKTPRSVKIRPANIADYTAMPMRLPSNAGSRCEASSSTRRLGSVVKSHMLWPALDQVPFGQAVLSEWESLLGGDFDSTRSLLGSTDEIAGYYPAPTAREIPWRVVEHGPDDFVAVCNQSGDTIPLRKRDVVIFSLDFRRLAKELAATFEFAPMFEAIDGIPRCWRVGMMAQSGVTSLPVHLVVPADSSGLRRAVESIRAAGLELGSILVPTRTCVTSAIETLVIGSTARLIVLEETLVARQSGSWVMGIDPTRVVAAGNALADQENDFPLSDRAQEILQAMLEMKAFDSDRRKTNAEVTLRAFGSSAEPNDQKEVFSDLKDARLLDVKRGRAGGYWLTKAGKSRAERLAGN